ncbi:MAG TPA: MauE/DoxX family redox-associated membrane protein [Solirubrobacteraceae bacterium]
MDSAVLGAQVLLAIVFATAGVGKLRDRAGSQTALTEFGVSERFAPTGAVLLPLAELAAAAALLVHQSARWGAVAALVLLLAFVAGISRALARGETPDCHCFGQIHSEPAGRGTLVRNGLLAAVALLVVVAGPAPAYDDWSGTELAAIGLGVAAILLAAVCLILRRDLRGVREDLAKAEHEASQIPPGLPIGATAPSFELRDLTGATRTLEALLEPGLPVALLFVSPQCGPCTALMPEIGGWQTTLAERVTIALISSGSSLDNQVSKDQHGLRNLLLQESSEVMDAYRVTYTPSAVMLTPDGRIGSVVVEGAFGIGPLLRVSLNAGADRHPPATWPERVANGAGRERQPSG